MSEQGKIEELTKSLKAYIQTNIELIKLEATERTSVIGSELISFLLIALTLFIFILFFSLSAGFYLASFFNDNIIGFAIVAGFYFTFCLILIIGRKNLITRPVRDKIIQKILKK